MDAAAYTQGDFFMREKQGLFTTAWLPLCARSQLEGPGAFVSATIGGWPLFAVRNAAGTLGGFRNTCRHQNMMVVESPAGRCENLRCRYHGWTYDLDGGLIAAPPLVAPPDLASPEHRLRRTALQEWGGLVMLCLNEAAAPVAGVPPAGSPAPAAAVTLDVACNWKVVVESRLEAAGGDGAGAPVYQWPLLFLRAVAGGVQVEQIIPRSFLRTRVTLYEFSGATEAEPRLRRELERGRGEWEAAHAARAAAGYVPAAGSAGAAFHERLLGALG